jgi:hypothetical protein
VGIAHAELLLVTCLRKENPPGNKNHLLSVRLLSDSLSPPVPQNKASVSYVWKKRGCGGHRAGPWPHLPVSRSLTASPVWLVFQVYLQSPVNLKNQANAPSHPSAYVVPQSAEGRR